VWVDCMGSSAKLSEPSHLTPSQGVIMRKESTIILFGNRVARRCQALSKQQGRQCRNAMAAQSSSVCKYHGYGGGPKTKPGRERCAAAKTIHGRETRQKRAYRSTKMAELYELETLGRKIGLISGPKTAGRKPNS
jgi:hypothetical protein